MLNAGIVNLLPYVDLITKYYIFIWLKDNA